MSKVIELRQKTKSIESIYNMAAAMQVVAVAQLRAIQTRQRAAAHLKKHYDRLAKRLKINIKPDTTKIAPTIRVYVLSSHRGFCGGFNDALVRTLKGRIGHEDFDCVVIGGKGCEVFKGKNVPARLSYLAQFEKMGFNETAEIASEAYNLYRSGKVKEVYILFNEFASMLVQTPRLVRVLPFDLSTIAVDSSMIIMEPSRKEVKRHVSQNYLQVVFYDAFMQSLVGEVASRLITMRGATDNSKEMIADLQLKLNKARQAMITFELSEIISSFEVLKEEES